MMFEHDGDYVLTLLLGVMVTAVILVLMNLMVNPETPLSKAINACTNHSLVDRQVCLSMVDKHFERVENE